jgi:hypothetical protein
VLIEGPTDASALLPLLANRAMVMPVALLTYSDEDSSNASFFPFADYSPEYQAALWAVNHGAAVRFIDLPASDQLAQTANRKKPTEEKAKDGPDNPADDDKEPPATSASTPPQAAADTEDEQIRLDPIGALARVAGYDDGESWWSDVIEENPASGPVFAAVANAMTALRSEEKSIPENEAAREAHMRLEIAKAAKESKGSVAVVCGAWHVPALAEKRPATADRELLKGRPKVKVKATWVPWTAPRLAIMSGYGAGVAAPGWFGHLWQIRKGGDRGATWLAKAAAILRDKGYFVSTASVIEAQRLGTALAALRERPASGFAELGEAAIACLCNGESALWDQISTELLIGTEVGAISPDVPLAPLLEDLQIQQKATRLKPEALDRELTLDLRSESGLARSTLLHRLAALNVPWGKLTDAGRSRGTFRENWKLRWDPEFAVRLVECLVYGSTIENAAAGRIIEMMQAAQELGELAGWVRAAMTAGLSKAIDFGIAALQTKAALTSDCRSLLVALPPMADIMRYGEARAGSAQRLGELMPQMVVQAALALPYAVRNLAPETAAMMRGIILKADSSIQLVELEADVVEQWRHELETVLDQSQTTKLIAGTAARLLYEADRITPESIADILSRMLSPGTPIPEAAGFFEGFFEGAGQRLIHDAPLREAVDVWMMSLDAESFTSNLPLFRRVFSALDRTERKRLMDELFGRRSSSFKGYTLLPDASAIWTQQQARVLALLEKGKAKNE